MVASSGFRVRLDIDGPEQSPTEGAAEVKAVIVAAGGVAGSLALAWFMRSWMSQYVLSRVSYGPR